MSSIGELISNERPNQAPVQQSEAVREYVRAEKSPNTRRAYRSDCEVLAAWCKARQWKPLPLRPGQLAEFLAEQAKTGVRAVTLMRRVAAIRHAHRMVNLPDPMDSTARAVIAGIRKQLGVKPNARAPICSDDLRKMVAAIPQDRNPLNIRDRALLLLGFAAALRRSEIVNLDVQDVRFCQMGLRITIRQSKTDQEARGADVAVPFGSAFCPVAAVRAWIEFAELKSGPLFRPIGSVRGVLADQRLENSRVAIIVKKRAILAGLDASKFSGHSLRSGFLTSAARNGASLFKMMDQSRHRSVESVRRYVRDARLFENNAGEGLL